jgi:hypothetical protein
MQTSWTSPRWKRHPLPLAESIGHSCRTTSFAVLTRTSFGVPSHALSRGSKPAPLSRRVARLRSRQDAGAPRLPPIGPRCRGSRGPPEPPICRARGTHPSVGVASSVEHAANSRRQSTSGEFGGVGAGFLPREGTLFAPEGHDLGRDPRRQRGSGYHSDQHTHGRPGSPRGPPRLKEDRARDGIWSRPASGRGSAIWNLINDIFSACHFNSYQSQPASPETSPSRAIDRSSTPRASPVGEPEALRGDASTASSTTRYTGLREPKVDSWSHLCEHDACHRSGLAGLRRQGIQGGLAFALCASTPGGLRERPNTG